jgi:predicted esterase
MRIPLAVACVASVAGAQTRGADTLSAGRIVPVVASRSDTTERYALYLPSRYDPSRRWPALLVMDPGGRALRGVQLFQEAAERDGYVVLSSYNTVADSTEDPNEAAVNAMLNEIQTRYAVDMRRVYFAGLSGTARLAWGFAAQLGNHVAGVIGFGAGLPWSNIENAVQLRRLSSLAFFGGAGTVDFNYDEVTTLDAWLDSLPSIPHRVAFYPGPHRWPPPLICGQALDWMQLQAMRAGLTPVDDSAVRALYDMRSAAARAALDSGDVYAAWRDYRRIVADFTGLHDVTAASTEAATQARSPELRRAIDRRQRLRNAFAEYREGVLSTYLDHFNHDRHVPTTAASLRQLDIPSLQRQAADTTDRLGADAAQRTLNSVYATISFYAPRAYVAAGDSTRALALLEVARAIRAPTPPETEP